MSHVVKSVQLLNTPVMTWSTPSWFEQIQKMPGLTGLELWTADFPLRSTQRVAARDFLLQKWPQQFDRHEEVLDLTKRPAGKSMMFSISHCPLEVGVLAAPDGIEIGLDIEVADRVTDKTVSRISDDTEILEMPSPAHLWAAKESFYKSVEASKQPQTIFDIRIDNWTKVSEQIWGFDGRVRKKDIANGYGFVLREAQRVYAFAFQE